MRPSRQHTSYDDYVRSRVRRQPVNRARFSVDGMLPSTSIFTSTNISKPSQVKPWPKPRPRSQANPTPNRLQTSVLKPARHGPKKSRRKIFTLFMPALAAIVFALGVYVSVNGFRTNKQVEAQVTQLQQGPSNTGENDIPAEDKPGNITGYQVSPDLPRYIRINKLNLFARVTRLGIKSNNELQSPFNVHDAGWYEGSSKPGENGASLLAGHVHGPTVPGVFYELKAVVTGDKIEVERGDGKIFRYRVVKTTNYDVDKVDMAAALVSTERGRPGLNLITCSGDLDDSGDGYKQRLIVFAVAE